MIGVWQPKTSAASQRILRGFDNFTGFNAAGANLHPSVSAGRKLNADWLQIRVEPAAGFIVRMRNIVSKLRAFPANVASLCHI